MPTQRHRYDVVVVGARAAGAATAMLLARQGHDVLLVDRTFFPADTISTHQLARPGVVQLHRWGLLPDVLASGAPAIRDVSFTAAGETVRRTVKDSAGVDLLVAPRRQVLDTIVVEAAVAAGVVLCSGVSITAWLSENGLPRIGNAERICVNGRLRTPAVAAASMPTPAAPSPRSRRI